MLPSQRNRGTGHSFIVSWATQSIIAKLIHYQHAPFSKLALRLALLHHAASLHLKSQGKLL